jgi:hypothetical protein
MPRSSAPPPASSSGGVRGPRKRPWYLVAALVGAWIFGATAMSEGCAEISFYKSSDRVELAQTAAQELGRDIDPAAAVPLTEHYYSVLDGAKNRVFPIAVAALLLGAAMWGLAAGAMAGRSGARSALVQVIAVHAALIVVNFAITPDVRAAEAEARAKVIALSPMPRAGPVREGRRLLIEHTAVIPVVRASMRLFGYGLVLLALTRRRTREFFEASGAARAEP